jgi:GxxExxY protein
MNTDTKLKGHVDISEAVIGAAFKVSNTLGAGFLEKVYENALALELRRQGHAVEQQRPVEVWYEGERVVSF